MPELKYLDENGLTYLWSKIKTYVTEKIADVSGGVSDYADLTNKPKINGVELSGNKTTADLNISIPVNVSQLTNDSGYQTASDVQELITAAGHIEFEKVDSVPDPGSAQANTIYLVPNQESGNNVYDEYFLIDGKMEIIGTTQADLENYVMKSDLVAITNLEIDDITNA